MSQTPFNCSKSYPKSQGKTSNLQVLSYKYYCWEFTMALWEWAGPLKPGGLCRLPESTKRNVTWYLMQFSVFFGPTVLVSCVLSLNWRLQQGQQLHLRPAAAAEGSGGVGSQVGQQQLGAPVQQAEHVLRQTLHRRVAHHVQVEDVLQEVEHLVLQEWHTREKTGK